jgi:hypothetical protein
MSLLGKVCVRCKEKKTGVTKLGYCRKCDYELENW